MPLPPQYLSETFSSESHSKTSLSPQEQIAALIAQINALIAGGTLTQTRVVD